MRKFFDPRQLRHAPARELHNGGFTDYAETPARAEAILAAILGRFRPADRGQDGFGAGRCFGIIGEAPIMQLARRRVEQLPGVEEFAHHAPRAGRATQRSTTNPARPERIEPISTPTLTRSISAGSIKASPPMNRLIVKPIPASSNTP